ncbi:hypothetical protein IFM46972_11536 [Aspergillus udagawae]|uniref:LysM domain-containing protein n=1 Tax=Aspergillus udagawae TaxID=91492 RepID=A0A8H3XSF8_9EURO|nr:hypothetical protein IFM46972_11536 [Aspergillus udagawae]
MPGISENCDGFYKISSGDQCDTIAKARGISMAKLKSRNSAINDATIRPAFTSPSAKSLEP